MKDIMRGNEYFFYYNNNNNYNNGHLFIYLYQYTDDITRIRTRTGMPKLFL